MITCNAGTYGSASWPTYAPFGVDTYVNGTCNAGYTTTDPSSAPQRLCPAIGTYSSTIINACVRTLHAAFSLPVREHRRSCRWLTAYHSLGGWELGDANLEIYCSADYEFDNANWTATAAGSTAYGTCVAGFQDGAPERECLIDGTWSSNVTNPCSRKCRQQRPPRFRRLAANADSSLAVRPKMRPHVVAILCTAISDLNGAAFASTDAGSTATGSCIAGYKQGTSAPTLACSLTGVWSTSVVNPCIRTKSLACALVQACHHGS